MLALDDIQHILLTRAPALAARYEFLSFHNPAAGRRWLAGILPTVQSAAEARASAADCTAGRMPVSQLRPAEGPRNVNNS